MTVDSQRRGAHAVTDGETILATADVAMRRPSMTCSAVEGGNRG
jgi:hypothetical protein